MTLGRRNAKAGTYLYKYEAGLLWRTIATEGLNANDFQVDVSELRGYTWKLYHKPTGQALHASHSYTDADAHGSADILRTQPYGKRVAYQDIYAEDYIGIVRDWAEELKAAKVKELLRGDGSAPSGFADDQTGENTPFTPAERADIINQLRAIHDSVRRNYRLSAEQLAAIDKRLQEAEEASKRLGRKDWQSLFYGIVFGLIVNDAVPPDVAQHIFTGVINGIAHLLGGGGFQQGPWMLGS
jgi:hypothetical protein